MNPETTNQNVPVSSAPIAPQAPIPGMPPIHEEKALGPAIGVVIIIFVLVLGGLYFWGQRMNTQKIAEEQMQVDSLPPVTAEPQVDAQVMQLKVQGSGDDITSIDADLKSTDTTNLGTEVNSMNAEANTPTQ